MLQSEFYTIPLAHRGYHDQGSGIIENSSSAVARAIHHGYGIEIDLQLSSDDQAMVFHDYDLERLTNKTGKVRELSATQLGAICLKDSSDHIPTLSQILQIVDGKAPILIELKDQSKKLGKSDGKLEHATINALSGYSGPFAVMSFNPHMVEYFAQHAPHIIRGLTTCDFCDPEQGYTHIEHARLQYLTQISDYQKVAASFISHDHKTLNSKPVQQIKASGGAILCWTVRSVEQSKTASKIADNITFEGYAA